MSVFEDVATLLGELSSGPPPLVILADDPPPGATRLELERGVESSGGARCIFLRDVSGADHPDGAREFATEEFTLNPPDLLELLERLTAKSDAASAAESIHPASVGVSVEAVKSALFSSLSTFVRLIERYEFVNGGNGPLVQRYAVEVAKELGLPAVEVEAIHAASLLYDIGMMRVRPDIKLKTTALSADERRIIREHVRYGAEFCESLNLPWNIRAMVLHHHERYDGGGYPDGLAGKAIPIGARIIAVGDAYFAMLSKRTSRLARSEDEALEELRRYAGLQFDPDVVEIWCSLIQVSFLGELEVETERSPRRIVLVDDDSDLRVLLASRLEGLNYQLDPINDPTGLLPSLIESPPEAIVINADLVSVDALQMLHRVRQEPALGGIVVLVMASRDSPVDRSRATASGADDFIVSPSPVQEVVSRLTRAIRRKQKLTEQHFVRPLARAGFHGHLSDMNLIEVCQVLAQGQKTARVRVTDTDTGELYFEDGRLKHASFLELIGEEAFYALLRIDSGEFWIDHGALSPSDTIEERLEYLLMEGMRLIDEERREGSAVR